MASWFLVHIGSDIWLGASQSVTQTNVDLSPMGLVPGNQSPKYQFEKFHDDVTNTQPSWVTNMLMHLPLGQNSCNFVDNISLYIFMNKKFCILI